MSEGKATENHTRQVLFVCTANVCRSPMAEAIFNALAEERGLAWRAESAGVAALKGEDITPNARAALDEVGIYTNDHRARQVGEEMLGEADLVLGMGPRHVAALRRRFGGHRSGQLRWGRWGLNGCQRSTMGPRAREYGPEPRTVGERHPRQRPYPFTA